MAKTIYDTALEIATEAVAKADPKCEMGDGEFAVAVYRQASRCAAVLGRVEMTDALWYAANADSKTARIEDVVEKDGKPYVLVSDPSEQAEPDYIEIPDGDGNASTEGSEVEPVAEGAVGSEEVSSEDGEGEDTAEKAEDGAPAVEKDKGDDVVAEETAAPAGTGSGDNPAVRKDDWEEIELASNGVFADDLAEILPDCIGRVCEILIGTGDDYSLDNIYQGALAGKAIRITPVEE